MSNKRFIIQRFRFPKILTCKVFNLKRGRGNETSTNIVWYLYSFRALFVLYEAVLDNNYTYYNAWTTYANYNTWIYYSTYLNVITGPPDSEHYSELTWNNVK